MTGPDVYESPRATYVSGGGGGLGLLVGKHATANKPNVSTTASRRPVTKPPPDGRNPLLLPRGRRRPQSQAGRAPAWARPVIRTPAVKPVSCSRPRMHRS